MRLINFRSQLFWLVEKSWVLAFLLPIIYLVSNVAYFNKDDNFSQFTPIFQYAYESLLRGEFPWMHPGELNIRLAESPYYAIFSPVLFFSFLITYVLGLEPYWIVNFWALIYFTLISLLLLKFAQSFSIPSRIQGLLLICAGIGSFMGQFSVNWYYTLPLQLLLITKIYYWQYFLIHKISTRKNDALLLVVTYLAAYGGNPQLYLYVQIVEFLFLLGALQRRVIAVFFRNQLISVLLLAPWIYCQLEYWGGGWRSIYNPHKINIFEFIKSGVFKIYQAEGQSIWVIACVTYLVFSILRRGRRESNDRLSLSLALVSVLLLLCSSIDIGSMFGNTYPMLQIFTAPAKWWFFGGITSVFAVCLWSRSWTTRVQTYFAIFTLITSGIYLTHNLGKAAHYWKDLDYKQVNPSIQIIEHYADENSRILQLTNFRNTEPRPDSHLMLNTWLVGNFNGLVFAKGYETVQAKENYHRDLTKYFESQNLSYNQYQKLGVSTLWVNKLEYPQSLFTKPDYQIPYEDQTHYLVKLHKPGKIVNCEYSNCAASIRFYPNRISLTVDEFSANDIVRVKVIPYTNFVINGDRKQIPKFTCDDDWLCFKPLPGVNSYQIEYQDPLFLLLLISSNVLFLILLLLNQIWPRMRNQSVKS